MGVKLNPNAKLHVAVHPLIEHKVTLLRDQQTSTYIFRRLIFELTLLLAYDATKNLQLRPHAVTTPMLETYQGKILPPKSPVIIPILRAGSTMAEALLELIPDAKIGHIGLARDEATHACDCYYFKVPEQTKSRSVFVCDPMLATGGSVTKAVSLLKEHDIHNITLICLIAVPEGINQFSNAHPDVPIHIACLDRELNEKAYILPGLGDAGDRVCGTVDK